MQIPDFQKTILSLFKDYFGVVTFGTVALGYIGFYTYSSLHSLPFVHPEFSQIIGIGIASWILIAGFYLSSGGIMEGRRPAAQAGALYAILVLITFQFNPVYLFLFVGADIDRWDFILPNKKQDPSKKRKHNLGIALIWLIILLMAIFLNFQVIINYGFIYTGVFVFSELRSNIIKAHKIILTVIFTPIFLFGFFLNDVDSTLLGLSNANVTLTEKDGAIIKGKMIFKDDNYFYLEDTLNTINSALIHPFAPEIKRSISISKDEVTRYEVGTFATSRKVTKSFLNLFRTEKASTKEIKSSSTKDSSKLFKQKTNIHDSTPTQVKDTAHRASKYSSK